MRGGPPLLLLGAVASVPLMREPAKLQIGSTSENGTADDSKGHPKKEAPTSASLTRKDNQPDSTKNGEKTANNPAADNSDEVKWTDKWIAILTVVLACLAAAQFAAAGLQARWTRKTVEVAKESSAIANISAERATHTVKTMEITAVAQLRAYVSAFPDFMHSFKVGDHPFARFRIHNTGTSPAHDLQHRGSIIVAPTALKAGMSFPDLTSAWCAKVVAFPNLPLHGGVRAPKPITQPEIDAIVRGDARIYVYGDVRYVDAFGNPRTTSFCAGVNATTDVRKKITTNYEPSDLTLNFEAAPMGNTAT